MAALLQRTPLTSLRRAQKTLGGFLELSSRRRLSHSLTDAFTGAGTHRFGGAAALFDSVPATGHLRRIPIDRIRPRTERPRRTLDADALDELAASIRAHGVLQPIRVRSCGGGRYEIVAGERRWIAARQAGLRDVPALIAASDDDHAYIESLVENIQREDLNAVDRAHALRHLRVNLGLHSWEEVGRVVGITRQHVYNLLRVTQLPESMQDDVRAGDLTEKHARALLLLRDDAQAQSALWERIHDEELSGDAAMEAAQRRRAEQSVTALREVRPAAPRDDDEGWATEPTPRAMASGALRINAAVETLLDLLAESTPAELAAARPQLEALQGRLRGVLDSVWEPVLVPVAGRSTG